MVGGLFTLRLTMLVTLCYGRHRNHGVKQEAECCKISAQLMNGDKYKGHNRHTQLHFQTATGPSAIHNAEIQNELQVVSGSNVNPESRCREQLEPQPLTTCSYRGTQTVTVLQSGKFRLASRKLREVAETLQLLAEFGPILLLHF